MTGRVFPGNEGAAERVMRVALGLGVLSLTLLGPKTLWGFLGLVPIVAGLLGSCSPYTLSGISTCRMKAR